MAIIPIRADNGYVGLAPQVSQGVPVAPTFFPRWMDGTSIQVEGTFEDVWEGDGSRRLSQVIKNRQMVKFKLVDTPRPILLGLIESAAMGSGSDTITAPTASTTTAGASNTVGSTTLTLTASTGLTGSGTASVVVDPGTATEEIVSITTPGTGAGPFVFTIANGGTLKITHIAGGAARTSASHAITDQSDGKYWTIEVSLGGTSGLILRITDCKVDQIKVSGKAGGLLMYETDWVGIASVAQVSTSTVTLENHSPFLYTQGVWTLNGLTTGDALAFEMFDITRKNNLDTSVQTEQVILAATIFGNFNADVAADIVYQNAQLIKLTYFGGTTGTTDSQTMGSGALSVIFSQPDGFHTVTYALATLLYTKVGMPQLKKDGKHFKQTISAPGTSNQGVNAQILTTTVTNGQTTAY